MVNEICTAIDNNTYNPALRTITRGGETPVLNVNLNRTAPLLAGGSLQLRQNGPNTVLGQITLAQLRVFEDVLLNYATSPTTYRNIKNNVDWQMTYYYAQRLIPYIDKSGNPSSRLEWTVPCRECGLLLHEKLMSVDHFKPRAGDPLDPIFKLFRSMGYTEQTPSGRKGQAMMGNVGTSAGGNTGGGSGAYELNPVGAIVFSLFRGSGYWTNLQNLSMHHFINLRPVCSFCNPSLGTH